MNENTKKEHNLEHVLREFQFMKGKDQLRNIQIPQKNVQNPIFPEIDTNTEIYSFQIHYESGPVLHIKRISYIVNPTENPHYDKHTTYCRLIGSGGLECGYVSFFNDKDGKIKGLENFNNGKVPYGHRPKNFSYVGINSDFKIALLDTLIFHVMGEFYTNCDGVNSFRDIFNQGFDDWRYILYMDHDFVLRDR